MLKGLRSLLCRITHGWKSGSDHQAVPDSNAGYTLERPVQL
jgi:hypothetical protein